MASGIPTSLAERCAGISPAERACSQGLTRVNFSAQGCAISDTKCTPNTPRHPMTPPKHPLNNPSMHPISHRKRLH